MPMSISQSYLISFTSIYHDLLSFGINKMELDRYLPSPLQQISITDDFKEQYQQACQVIANNSSELTSEINLCSLFERIYNHQKQKNTQQYILPIEELSPKSIFPIKKNNISTTTGQRDMLFLQFLEKLAFIPSEHRENIPLWLDHFDTALQCFFSHIPSPINVQISLYDHIKVISALTTVLSLSCTKGKTDDKPILLIQGDFFGIQNFIFSGGNDTNKHAAKLLRGRSFQISLFTELAALKILETCELPSYNQIINAAGKFLIIAPNNDETIKIIQKIQSELNDWFIQHTFGLISLGIATKSAKCKDLSIENFHNFQKILFEQLEKTKLQQLNLTQNTTSVQNRKYCYGICRLNNNFPAENEYIPGDENSGLSLISSDQVKIGKLLALKNFIIISNENSNNKKESLGLTILGYKIFFIEEKEIREEKNINQIIRLWSFTTPENIESNVWNGYAHRYINAYIPYFKNSGKADNNKYSGIDESNICYQKNSIKTFDYIACEDRELNNIGEYQGEIAVTTLKGDVDNLGMIFQEGLMKPSIAEMTALSRQINLFFSLWLPAYCAESSPNMYTVFAGGDDFFLIGPWNETQKMAYAMQQAFERYVAYNPNIHFSAGMVMSKIGIPVNRLGEIAEAALDQAKSLSGKNSVTIYQKSVKWDDLKKLREIEYKLFDLTAKYSISASYFYSLIHFANQAGDNNLESTMWRSRFYYKTARYIIDKLPQNQRNSALDEIIDLLGKNGIEYHKQAFKIPLFNYFYQKR